MNIDSVGVSTQRMTHNKIHETNAPYGTHPPMIRQPISLYCGDARPADVPAMNFWRSKDMYSDHMVRVYELNGFPLSRIDNASFMIGAPGTCYGRCTDAWQGMLLLSLARGGWVNTYYVPPTQDGEQPLPGAVATTGSRLHPGVNTG